MGLTTKQHKHYKEETIMKGYYVANGFMGYVEGSFRLFASEADYYEYMED